MGIDKDSWEGKNVFLTGANGFLGSNIAKTLVENKANVIVLLRDNLPQSVLNYTGTYNKLRAVLWGDITNYKLVERILNEYEIDTCIHVAAQAIVTTANTNPTSTFESNIKGTWTILEACRNAKNIESVVVASSDKTYGDQEKLPYTEESTLNACYPYDASKACTDILCRTYFKTYELPVAVTRCANIYGGGDLNFSRIVPDTIRLVLQGKPPVIRSDGTPVRDFVYVGDIVNAYLTLAQSIGKEGVNGEAFNFGSNSPISVLDLAKKIIDISGKEIVPDVQGKSKPNAEIDKQYLSIEKAKKILGWEPKFSLEEGLKKTIAWYDEFFNKQE
ncbi:MAG: GDP-mannose 4,6-dehydratase [Candidatus Aenigmarchaeota archaeon]|nr:GDP-mannose 4,6-dehydratase [Candidatus Aenigmarchaeota archaeon]